MLSYLILLHNVSATDNQHVYAIDNSYGIELAGTDLKALQSVTTNRCPSLLNQARAGRRPVRAWFLKTDPVRIVGMRVCVCVCLCVRAQGY